MPQATPTLTSMRGNVRNGGDTIVADLNRAFHEQPGGKILPVYLAYAALCGYMILCKYAKD
jgi:hypothetical protein